ncbi:MAG: hypothetical protein CO094_03985 [Anaerolineae bacterium CG_4_9_14_3_um_filter_57_17]|nr:MAG: hypothetical protein CO094_03985 [Anaerolineae bacterium CG_4_9_14_3_um_filter_57_17]
MHAMPVTHFLSEFSRRPDRRVWLRRLISGIALTLALTVELLAPLALSAGARPNQLLGASMVISEIRFHGSAQGNDEFIEVFNPTQSAIDITGWKLVRSTSTGTSPSTRHVFGTVSLQPGQFYLVASASYDDAVPPDAIANGSGAATPAVNSNFGIADDGGVALEKPDGTKIDQVGLGTTSYGEGNLLPQLTADTDQGYARVNVCEDTNDNATDFVLTNPSDPQNSSSTFSICPAPTAVNTAPPWYHRVIINEIAWGGTPSDGTAGQWIELYNPDTTNPIDITGWHLVAADGVPDISLSGSIAPGGYFLLARRSDVFTTLPINQVFLDALNPGGESLRLVTSTGSPVDSANGDGGPWPAGSGFAPYASMERNGRAADSDAIWITFAGTPSVQDRLNQNVNGTPGAANWATGLTQTPSPTPTATFTATPTLTSTPSLTPTQTATDLPNQALLINEVAWAGTAASSSDEWIELYNPGITDIALTGWTLTSSDATLNISLSGTIPAQGYFLLERSDDNTISDITADQIYSVSLTNTGQSLRLKDTSGQTVDTANSNGGGWPAGNATTFCSMERRSATITDSDTAWITNTGIVKNGLDANSNPICGTPKNVNWAYFVTPTPSPRPSSTGTRTPTKTPTRTPVTLSSVVINEFLPHARSDWNRDGRVDYGDEFIEIINVSTQSVSLSGWWLDDQTGDSPTFALPAVSLAPGAKLVYFASETGILLSNRGDSVRLYKSTGQPMDVFTYTRVPEPDQSYCRLPDGRSGWQSGGCAPTPGENNKLAEIVFVGEQTLPAFCLRSSVPAALFPAECLPSGLEAWSRAWWDGVLPGFQRWLEWDGENYLLE